MPIENTTVYTYERLLRFSQHATIFRYKWLMISSMIWSLLFLFVAIVFIVLWGAVKAFLPVFALIAALWLWNGLLMLLPRLTIKKSPNVGAELHYVFDAEGFTVHARTAHAEETKRMSYSGLTKVVKNKTEIYLFISAGQAHLVDAEAFSAEQLDILKITLSAYVPPKKMKWLS